VAETHATAGISLPDLDWPCAVRRAHALFRDRNSSDRNVALVLQLNLPERKRQRDVLRATLKAMMFCCLPSLNEMKVDGKDLVAITFDPLEILNYLKLDFPPMNQMCDRAEMFEDRIYGRTKRVFEYFGLPFDAPPP
jgi:hypothetical protein